MQIVSRRSRVVASALAVIAAFGLSTVAFAHDEIESSVPEHRAQLDDPISQVTVDFGEPVGGVELGLRGPDDERIPGDVTVLSDTEARLDFAELTDEGQYIVQYLAEDDGHLVAGAISFTYGDASASNTGTWIIFGIVAAAILAIGAFFSFRGGGSGSGSGGSSDADDDIAEPAAT